MARMTRTALIMIVVMLLHGLFTCAVAAGHTDKGNSQTGYAYDSLQLHAQGPESVSVDDDSTTPHDKEFHAHVSCLTGYCGLYLLPLQPNARFEPQPPAALTTHLPPAVPPPNV
jgi:hypothetical protein